MKNEFAFRSNFPTVSAMDVTLSSPILTPPPSINLRASPLLVAAPAPTSMSITVVSAFPRTFTVGISAALPPNAARA